MASTQKLNFPVLIPTHVALIFPYLSQLDKKTSNVVSEICMWFPKQHDSLSKPHHEICFRHSQYVVSRQHVGLYVESKLHGYVDSRFACFYLIGQLESILQKFQLAEVVLVVSKPHVFNLTRQLVSTPPECSTLAATDLVAISLRSSDVLLSLLTPVTSF